VVLSFKMPKTSAGLLMYKIQNNQIQIFLVHPGGPFFKNKDIWGIPKGEIKENEDLLEAAKREFKEETGIQPKEPFIPLEEVKMASGKIVHCWAFEGDWSGLLISNYFKMEWPPKSGKFISVPEIDKAQFFSLKEAKQKINKAQKELIGRLENHLKQKGIWA